MNSNWSYSPETKIWVVTSVTLTFDLWPWPFAWTLPWSNVITPENFMMIRWWEHSQKGVTDGQTDRRADGRTDRRTENTIHRAAWSQLKNRHNPNRWIPIWLLLVQNYIYTPNGEISKGSFSEFHPVAIWEGIMRVHVNTASTLNVLIIYSCPGQFLYHDTSSWIITGDIKPLI